MEFKETFFCLGKIREREDQEKGDVHLEAGDQPLKTNPCSSAFFSSQTWLVCSAYLFMAKLLGKFGINKCFFFSTGQITGTTQLVLHWLLPAQPPHLYT